MKIAFVMLLCGLFTFSTAHAATLNCELWYASDDKVESVKNTSEPFELTEDSPRITLEIKDRVTATVFRSKDKMMMGMMVTGPDNASSGGSDGSMLHLEIEDGETGYALLCKLQ